jgi:putative transposase
MLEFITPYTPEQNGMIERFFRSLKEECVWQHSFVSFEHARRELSAWIRWYNQERPGTAQVLDLGGGVAHPGPPLVGYWHGSPTVQESP